MKFSFITFFK